MSLGILGSRAKRIALALGILLLLIAPAWAATYRLTWQDVATGETSWRIERCLAASCTYAELTPAAANATTYDDTTAVDATNYKYRIRAGYAGGVYSVYSNEVCRPTDCSPAAPTNVHITGQTVPPQILLVASTPSSTYWTGILDPSRAIDWTTAGVEGGIPSSGWSNCTTTACNTLWNGGTDGTQVTAANIQAAINSCSGLAASPCVVRIPGNGTTRTMSTTITLKSYVALRGQGANQTILTWSGASGCFGSSAALCIWDGASIYYGSAAALPGGSNGFTWASGFARGAVSISVSAVGSAGILNGDYIYLDQAEDPAITDGFYVCANGAGCSSEGNNKGRLVSGTYHPQVEIVKVVSGCATRCSGAGPFALTITPGLRAPNWSASRAPGGYFAGSTIKYAGIENLSANTTSIEGGMGTQSIAFIGAANCWFTGNRVLRQGPESVVFIMNSTHVTVANNYFYGGGTGGVGNYGIQPFFATDTLMMNNIGHWAGALIIHGMGIGNVAAYNYSINQPRAPDTWMSQEIWEHDNGTLYALYEGNVGSGLVADVYHGNTLVTTAFRNRFTGTDTGSTQNTLAVSLWSFNRHHNLIGNVLGTLNTHSTYQAQQGNGGVGIIYGMGDGNSQVANDALVASTSMRWGNYDVVTGTNEGGPDDQTGVRWCGNSSNTGWVARCASTSEVPTGLAAYANAVPVSETLPNSFFLSAKPTWFKTIPWPPIGPDVTSGNLANTGGHANKIPAMACYLDTMSGPADGTGSVLSFNAASCYE